MGRTSAALDDPGGQREVVSNRITNSTGVPITR